MGKTSRIMRISTSTFLNNLPVFASTAALLALPFSLSTLLSPPLVSASPAFTLIHSRLQALFLAAGFPPSSDLFAVLNLKLSQTLLSFVFLLPFTLSSLLLSKACVIRRFMTPTGDEDHRVSPFVSWISTLNPLVATQFCNALVLLSANATCFSLLIVLFNAFDFFFSGVLSCSRNGLLLVSAAGAVAYSIVAANAYVVCSLALIVSGVEGRGGFGSVLKACALVRGRAPTALALAVWVNAALAGVEALFQHRVVRRGYGREREAASGVAWPVVAEAALIGYMYAVVLVVDAIVGCVFLKSCGVAMGRVAGGCGSSFFREAKKSLV